MSTNDRQLNKEETTDQPAPSDLWPGDDVMSPPTPYVFHVKLEEVKKPFRWVSRLIPLVTD